MNIIVFEPSFIGKLQELKFQFLHVHTHTKNLSSPPILMIGDQKFFLVTTVPSVYKTGPK